MQVPYKIILLVFFSSFLPLLSFSQILDWEFNAVEIPGGYGGNKVQAIIQDHNGYLWIGSQNGLYRFDGKAFKSYVHNPADANSISDNYIECIYEDSKGDIWIGTVGNGVSRFDPITENFTRYYDEILDSGSGKHTLVNSIEEDREGNIWIASLSGLSKFDRKKKIFTKYRHDPNDPNSLSNDLATVVYCDKAGKVWIGTGFYWFSGNKGGLNQYVPEKDHFIRYMHDSNNELTISNNSVWSILEDQEGHFWVGTGGNNGLNLMDRSTGTFTRFKFDPEHPEQLSAPNIESVYKNNSVGLRRVFEDQQGQLWLLTYDRALGIYDLKTQQSSLYPIEEFSNLDRVVPTSRVFNILQAKDGSVWLSSGSSGPVMRVLPSNTYLKFISLKGLGIGIENIQIIELFESRQADVWLGLTEGKFVRLNAELKNSQIFHNKDYSKGAPSAGNMRVIFEDQSDKIWIGINNRIEHFDLASRRFNAINIPLPTHSNVPTEQPIFALNQQANGDYWIGTLSWGLFRYTPGTETYKHFHPDLDAIQRLSNRSVSNIFLDNHDQLWVTGGDIPIFVPNLDAGFLDQWSDERDRFIRHLPDGNQKILGRMPVSIEQTKEGTLWFVSWGGGLHAYAPSEKKLSYFNPTEGNFPDWDTRWLVFDKEENKLWIGTRHDVYQFDPETYEYIKYALFADRPGESDHGKAIMQASGEILFAWGEGLYQFNPKKYDLERAKWKAPVVHLADLYINEKKVPIGKESILKKPLAKTKKLSLNYNQNQFGVEIHNFHFKNPDLNRVAYKLEPYDSKWRILDKSQLAQYRQVQPGAYTFFAKGYSSEGLESETISLSIRVLPPWWQSTWAYIAYCCLLISILILARQQIIKREKLRSQLKLEQIEKEKVQEIDQLRSRFFANISHEFRTPLTLIKAPLEDLLASKRTPDDRLTFLKMHENTGRLLHLVNQLLDLSRLESGILQLQLKPVAIFSFLRQLAANFTSLADQKHLKYHIKIPDSSIILELDPDKLEKIVLNLLANAFKFTPENGWIQIEAVYQETLTIKVGNSGSSIPKAEQTKIFNRFYQAGDTRHQGAGIGLALVREFIDLHGGSLQLRSNDKEGTWFEVNLHAELVTLANTASSPVLVKTETTNTPTIPINAVSVYDLVQEHPLILIVEDEADVRTYIKQRLVPSFQILEAENGQEGLEKAKQSMPDLIISDVMMPIMDGVNFCQKLKTDVQTDHIPVILLTAKADIESRLLGLKTGADDYLAKPFNSQELILRCQNLITLRKKLQQRYQAGIQALQGSNTVTKGEAKFIARAINIVEVHLADPGFTAEVFAQQMYLSRQHLHRKLKQVTGMSATDFVRNIRLEKAVQLINDKDLNISQIAYQTGFNNLSYFAKCFKQKYGTTPSAYQKIQ